jgi:hypothetical protein
MLPEDERSRLVTGLMRARREIAEARRSGDLAAEAEARKEVDRTKRALGERCRVVG